MGGIGSLIRLDIKNTKLMEGQEFLDGLVDGLDLHVGMKEKGDSRNTPSSSRYPSSTFPFASTDDKDIGYTHSSSQPGKLESSTKHRGQRSNRAQISNTW